MSFFSGAAALALLIAAIAHPAAAKRGSWGWSEKLAFAAETQIDGPEGEKISLCILTKQRYIFGFINIWKSAETYGLATDRCETERYASLSDADFAAGQAAGQFPANLPSVPTLSARDRIEGVWGSLALLAVLLAAIAKGVGSRRRAKGRRAALGDLTEMQHRILEVMCQTAYVDGRIEDREVAAIADAAQQMAGRAFSPDQIRAVVATCDKNLSDARFKAFGKSIDDAGKKILLRAALMVAAADGDLAEKERAFIGKLAAGLGLSREQVQAIVSGA